MAPFDVIIIGAGASGINTAWHLKTHFPSWRFVILEARGAIGGTWDLYRYPGARTDSDAYTFSFPWHPWTGRTFGDGAAISQYLISAAKGHGIDQHILFHHRVIDAKWSPTAHFWTLCTEWQKQQPFCARYVVSTGLYRYDTPLETHIPGLGQFEGTVIHPQHWPNALDYTGKKIVIVGSGASAVTLLPALAEKACHVTMLQRSPSYIVPLPRADWMRQLPYPLVRICWIIFLQTTYILCRLLPDLSRWVLYLFIYAHLPSHVAFYPHFCPRYYPWDQRMCMSPGGDFFTALRGGKAAVVTSTIRTVLKTGILLDTEQFLDADIIVTATGLHLQVAGGMKVFINDEKDDTTLHCDLSQKLLWNGLMLQDIPNMFFLMGSPNMTWTLGVEVGILLMCRIVTYLDQNNKSAVVPRQEEQGRETRCMIPLTSTYVKAAASRIPKAGYGLPWAPRNFFILDYLSARCGAFEDGLHFTPGK